MQYEPLPIISKNFAKTVIALIDGAKHSLDIVVFDWRFYVHDPANPVSLFNASIARAVRRGVAVRCLVQNDGVIDLLRSIGCDARKLHTKRILHTKLIIIDRIGIVIGSHNYTQHAFSSNHEASIYVTMGDINNGFVEYYNNLFGL